MKTNKWIRAAFLAVVTLITAWQANAQFKVVGYMPSWSGSVSAIQLIYTNGEERTTQKFVKQ